MGLLITPGIGDHSCSRRPGLGPARLAALGLVLGACGSSGGDEKEYTIGGTVSGLTASGLVLRNNGGDDLTVDADGPFTF